MTSGSPIRLSSVQQREFKRQLEAKDRVVSSATRALIAAARRASMPSINYMVETGHWREPDFKAFDKLYEAFYREVIREAVLGCKRERFEKKKKLASAPPALPTGRGKVEALFKDARFWARIQKRSKKVSERIARFYRTKIKKAFDVIAPDLQQGWMTPEEAKKTIVEKLEASAPRAETVFRTETTNYFAKAQVAFFSDDDEILGFLFHSVTDSGRTSVCRSRHGLVYRKKDLDGKPDARQSDLLKTNTPALHYNCRSHLIPLANTPENRAKLSDPDRDPTKRPVAPLDSTFKK